jgi:protein Tex
MTDSQIMTAVAASLQINPKQVATVSNLLADGATIPFMARYRVEMTGGLDEEQLRAVRDALDFRREMEERRAFILDSIRGQGKLTPELEAQIAAAESLTLLEDLYLPYKPKRKTRASVAKEKGLEPLAQIMWEQKLRAGEPEGVAQAFVNTERGVTSVADAIHGAKDICAEWVSEHPEVRDSLRKQFREHGMLTAKKHAKAPAGRTVYEAYYEFKGRAKFIKPYQVLALNRGEREEVLSVDLDVWEEKSFDLIDAIIVKDDRAVFTNELVEAYEDSYKRLLFPSLERELRNELTEIADQSAISTFAENVRNLLMQPPLAHKVVMGIDPGFRTGCKVAVVDQTGKYLDGGTIFPTEPYKKLAEAAAILGRMITKHKVNLIAIGNGTGSRETEEFVAELIQNAFPELQYLIVSEAGASVYSASPIAKEEFPELEAAQRGNISIARRILDPLAELVKIDPKSIGVGLYQHDVSQVRLSKKLDDVVESCVNTVGVNLNTASAPLLSYVSGLSKSVAEHIVSYRNKNGAFKRRDEIKQVPGVGEFKFQQAAGFLRIPDGENPLDNTAIHPESYDAAAALCAQFDIDMRELNRIQNTLTGRLQTLNKSKTAEQLGIGVPTLDLIIENLLKPGRDPREALPKPLLRKDITRLEDLTMGHVMEGTVRNVVDFGAFVDVGLKQDGMLHISAMSRDGRRIENPHDVVAVGDILRVEVVSIDAERGRIGLKLV